MSVCRKACALFPQGALLFPIWLCSFSVVTEGEFMCVCVCPSVLFPAWLVTMCELVEEDEGRAGGWWHSGPWHTAGVLLLRLEECAPWACGWHGGYSV